METVTISREAVLGMEAGPEMDQLVAERVMGWTLSTGRWKRPDGTWAGWVSSTFQSTEDGYERFDPSSAIEAAWEIIGDRAIELTRHNHDWVVLFWPKATAFAATAPLAICRAALLSTL